MAKRKEPNFDRKGALVRFPDLNVNGKCDSATLLAVVDPASTILISARTLVCLLTLRILSNALRTPTYARSCRSAVFSAPSTRRFVACHRKKVATAKTTVPAARMPVSTIELAALARISRKAPRTCA